MGYGIGGYLSISKQTAFGTPTASPVYIPFVSESLVENKNYLQIENLKNLYDTPDDLEGINNVTGDIVFEPHPIYLGHFLRACMGANPTSTLATSAYVHEFLPTQTEFAENCTLPPYTIQIFKNVGSAYQITDAQMHTLAIELTAGEIIKCTASVHGRAYAKVAKATPSYITADPYAWNTASLAVDGVANSVFESATITIENPIEGIAALDASTNEARLLRSDFRKITVTGDQSFENQAQEAEFRDGAQQRFLFTMKGAAIGAKFQTLTIDLPKVRYQTFEYPIGGPGRITAAYDGKAVYDTTSSYAARVTLTNTLAAY